MENAKKWFAIHVRSNAEFVAETEIEKKSMEVYLPSVQQLRQWHDRKKWIRCPLFPGYLFVNMVPSNQHFVNVLKTRGVVNVLGIQGGLHSAVPDEEIMILRKMVTSGKDLSVLNGLRQGVKVRIRYGALEGVEGLLTTISPDQYEITVNIKIIGRSVSVKLHPEDLEVI